MKKYIDKYNKYIYESICDKNANDYNEIVNIAKIEIDTIIYKLRFECNDSRDIIIYIYRLLGIALFLHFGDIIQICRNIISINLRSNQNLNINNINIYKKDLEELFSYDFSYLF